MSARAETARMQVRDYIASAAGDRGWDDTRQSWLARAASRLGMPYSRIKNLWYGRGRAYLDEAEEMRARVTEQKWGQRRQGERLHENAHQIQALVGGNASPLEREAEGGERAGPSAAAAPASRPHSSV